MGLYTTPSSYSGNSAAPWVNGINGIGRAFVQAPAMQAMAKQRAEQAALLQARQNLVGAQTSEAQARTGKLTAETGALDADEQSAQRLGAVFKRILANPDDTDAQGDAMIEAGRFFKKNPEQGSKALENLIASMKALGTNANPDQIALLQRGATSIVNKKAEIAASPNMVVQPGAAVIPKTMKAGERPIFTNPSAAAQVNHMAEPDKIELQSLFKQQAELDQKINDNAATFELNGKDNGDSGLRRGLLANRDRIQQRVQEIRKGGLGAALQRGTTGPAPAAATPAVDQPPVQAAQPASVTGDVQSFGSEQEARAAGFQSGQIVRLAGIGKVRLR
jgi:hypothetical protein